MVQAEPVWHRPFLAAIAAVFFFAVIGLLVSMFMALHRSWRRRRWWKKGGRGSS